MSAMISPPAPATEPRQWRAAFDLPRTLPRKLPRDLHLATLIGGALVVLSLLVAIVLAANAGVRNLVYPHPSIALTYITPSRLVHPGDEVHLSVRSAAGKELKYTWDFGDGASAAGTRATHAYAKYGYYTVTVTATDSIGQGATERAIVTVVPPSPKAAFGVSHDRWYNYIVKLDAGASVGADLHYYWDFGDGRSDASGLGRKVTHNFVGDGAFGVTLTVVDGAGQRSSTTIVVTVKSH